MDSTVELRVRGFKTLMRILDYLLTIQMIPIKYPMERRVVSIMTLSKLEWSRNSAIMFDNLRIYFKIYFLVISCLKGQIQPTQLLITSYSYRNITKKNLPECIFYLLVEKKELNLTFHRPHKPVQETAGRWMDGLTLQSRYKYRVYFPGSVLEISRISYLSK